MAVQHYTVIILELETGPILCPLAMVWAKDPTEMMTN